jgi:hypothetical protein
MANALRSCLAGYEKRQQNDLETAFVRWQDYKGRKRRNNHGLA